MPDPMSGLRRASSIGPAPLDSLPPVTQQSMGLPIPGPSKAAPGALQGLLGAVKPYLGPIAETLGEVSPEFTPVGGEGMFNMARSAAKYIPSGQSIVKYLGGMKP